MRQALTYDDIQLIPNFSAVQSRQDIKLHTSVSRNWSIDIPIVGSCMDTVTEFEMASTLMEMGGVGCLHRFMSIEEQVNQVKKLVAFRDTDVSMAHLPIMAAVGVVGDYLDRAAELRLPIHVHALPERGLVRGMGAQAAPGRGRHRHLQRDIPAAVHADLTSRVQVVDKKDNLFFWKIIRCFQDISGVPVILNTSFNRHGISTISSPRQAIEHLLEGTCDYLFIEGFLIFVSSIILLIIFFAESL